LTALAALGSRDVNVMSGMRQRAVRLFGGLLMAALLLVPVVASGHAHRDLTSSQSCAACIAAHHSPAIASAPAAFGGTILAALPLLLPTRVVRDDAHHTPRAGRAPPLAPVVVG
jgi:hypothetical protein